MIRKMLAAAALFACASVQALASSSINVNVPTQNSPLTSAPIRANFALAAQDINNILGQYAGCASPVAPTVYQYWANNCSNPTIISQWDGTTWIQIASVDTVAHTYTNLGLFTSILGVAHGGTGASSFSAGNPIIGNGTSALTTGTRSGNTTVYGTVGATLTPTICLEADSSGNIVPAVSALPCGAGGGGSGTVSPGLVNQIGYYTSSGSTIGGLATAANGILVTNGSGVPSIGTALPAGITFPAGLTIPSPIITSPIISNPILGNGPSIPLLNQVGRLIPSSGANVMSYGASGSGAVWSCSTAASTPTVNCPGQTPDFQPGQGILISHAGAAFSTASPPSKSLTASWASTAGGQVTFTTTSAHGLLPGYSFTVTGFTPSAYNASFTAIAGTSGTTIVAALVGSNPGTPTVNGTLGPLTFVPLGSTSGTRSYCYTIASIDTFGGVGTAVPPVCITNGPATLDTTNYNYLKWNQAGGNFGGTAIWRSLDGGAYTLVGLVGDQIIWQDQAITPIGPPVVPISPGIYAGQTTNPITAVVRGGGQVTFTTQKIHYLNVGAAFTVSGFTPTAYNQTYIALAGTTGSTIVAALSPDPGAPSVTGSVNATSPTIQAELVVGTSFPFTTSRPFWIPDTPPGSPLADWLIGTVSSASGSTVTLMANATTTVTSFPTQHDDTVAFQTAMLAANTGTGCRMDIPTGTYNISGQIDVPSSACAIEGAGANATYLNQIAYPVPIFMINGVSTPDVGGFTCRNVQPKYFLYDGILRFHFGAKWIEQNACVFVSNSSYGNYHDITSNKFVQTLSFEGRQRYPIVAPATPNAIPTSGVSWASTGGGQATFTTNASHGISVGTKFTVYGMVPGAYNGDYTALTGTVNGWPANAITNTVWQPANGGQAVFSTAVPHGVSVGSTFTVAGETPSGYNGTYTALAGTSGNLIVAAMASSPGPLTASGTLSALPSTLVGALTSNPGAATAAGNLSMPGSTVRSQTNGSTTTILLNPADAAIAPSFVGGRIQVASNGGGSYAANAITAAAWSGGQVILTTTTNHGVHAGANFVITGFTSSGPGSFNGTFTALPATAGSTLVAALASNPGTVSVLGTLSAKSSDAASGGTYSTIASYDAGNNAFTITQPQTLNWDGNTMFYYMVSAGLDTSNVVNNLTTNSPDFAILAEVEDQFYDNNHINTYSERTEQGSAIPGAPHALYVTGDGTVMGNGVYYINNGTDFDSDSQFVKCRCDQLIINGLTSISSRQAIDIEHGNRCFFNNINMRNLGGNTWDFANGVVNPRGHGGVDEAQGIYVADTDSCDISNVFGSISTEFDGALGPGGVNTFYCVWVTASSDNVTHITINNLTCDSNAISASGYAILADAPTPLTFTINDLRISGLTTHNFGSVPFWGGYFRSGTINTVLDQPSMYDTAGGTIVADFEGTHPPSANPGAMGTLIINPAKLPAGYASTIEAGATVGINTMVLSASSPLSIDAAGNITCSGCTGGGGGSPGGSSGAIQYNNGSFGGISPAAGTLLSGTSASTSSFSQTPVLGVPGSALGQLQLATAAATGLITLQSNYTGSTGATVNFPGAGTAAIGATSPIVLSSTGVISCPSCSAGLTGTAPISVGGGVVSMSNMAGGVLAGSTPAFTQQPVLGVPGSGLGKLGLADSGSAIITASPYQIGMAQTSTATAAGNNYGIYQNFVVNPASNSSATFSNFLSLINNSTINVNTMTGLNNVVAHNGTGTVTAINGIMGVCEATNPSGIITTCIGSNNQALMFGTPAVQNIVFGDGALNQVLNQTVGKIGTGRGSYNLISNTGNGGSVGQIDTVEPVYSQIVNSNGTGTISATASWAATGGGQVTFTTSLAHDVSPNELFSISGFTPTAYNGIYTALAGTSGTTLIGALTSNPGAATVNGSLVLTGSMIEVDSFLADISNSGLIGTTYSFRAKAPANSGTIQVRRGLWLEDTMAASSIMGTLGIGNTNSLYQLDVSATTRLAGVTIGTSSSAVVSSGEAALTKISASGTAPGAGNVKVAAVAGTTAGTCKLIVYAGTSVTPFTILDNIGAGC